MDKRELLSAVEAFIGGEPQQKLERVTLPSGRGLTVLSCSGAPQANLATHAVLEGPLAEWPDVKKGARLLPICVAHATEIEAPMWLAHVYDWCLTKGVAPRPKEVILSLGFSDALPHARMDYPFPWEREAAAELRIEEHRVVPVMMYPITDREGRIQHEHGPDALDAALEQQHVAIFDWGRPAD